MNTSSSTTADSLTSHVAAFIQNTRYADIPATVAACSKKAILDTLGVALAGAKSEGSEIIQRHVAELGCGSGGAAVFGTMVASASYIAAPAATRLAIPDANPGLTLGLALGVTFPFNLAVGIPVFFAVSRALA